jgi:hypothetical protein
MVNIRKRLINVVSEDQLKAQGNELEPKGSGVGTGAVFSPVVDQRKKTDTPGEQGGPNLPSDARGTW